MMIAVENIEIDNKQESSLLPLVKEYESMIETLTTQVQFYANEQENLRKEISALINENKSLGKTVNELLNLQSTVEKETEQQRNGDELIENLKRQLNLTIQEKDTAIQLWQNSLKNIDQLEEELKLFEGRTHGYFSRAEVVKIKQQYEKQITDIENELVQTNLKLVNLKKEFAKTIETKNADLNKALDDKEKTINTIKHLEKEGAVLQGKLKEIKRLRDELQKKLESKNGLIEALRTKDFESKAKVTEALEIVEAAVLEKDAALIRETKAKEEVLKISKALSEIMEEATEKIKCESEKIKQECDVKIREAHQSMKKLKEELKTKNCQLEKYMRECKLLEEEFERIKKSNVYIDGSNTSNLLVLEKNLESTFQKLLVSERKNLQLMSEKQYIKADIEQMANYYQNDIKTREAEMQALKQQIKSLQIQLKNSENKCTLVVAKITKMQTKFKLAYTELFEKFKSKDKIHKEALKKTLEKVQDKNKKEYDQLQKYLESQIKINREWKREFHNLIAKFETRFSELQKINKALKYQLKDVEEENLLYRKSSKDICASIINVNKDNKSVK